MKLFEQSRPVLARAMACVRFLEALSLFTIKCIYSHLNMIYILKHILYSIKIFIIMLNSIDVVKHHLNLLHTSRYNAQVHTHRHKNKYGGKHGKNPLVPHVY